MSFVLRPPRRSGQKARGGAEERKEILHKNEERILWSTDLKKTVEEFER